MRALVLFCLIFCLSAKGWASSCAEELRRARAEQLSAEIHFNEVSLREREGEATTQEVNDARSRRLKAAIEEEKLAEKNAKEAYDLNMLNLMTKDFYELKKLPDEKKIELLNFATALVDKLKKYSDYCDALLKKAGDNPPEALVEQARDAGSAWLNARIKLQTTIEKIQPGHVEEQYDPWEDLGPQRSRRR